MFSESMPHVYWPILRRYYLLLSKLSFASYRNSLKPPLLLRTKSKLEIWNIISPCRRSSCVDRHNSKHCRPRHIIGHNNSFVISVTWLFDRTTSSIHTAISLQSIDYSHSINTPRSICWTSFIMAPVIPTLLFAAAIEAFVLTLTIPQYLPHNPLFRTLIRTTLLNFGVYVIYKVFVYPFLLSPLRHLPSPGVGSSATSSFKFTLTNSRDRCPYSEMVWHYSRNHPASTSSDGSPRSQMMASSTSEAFSTRIAYYWPALRHSRMC